MLSWIAVKNKHTATLLVVNYLYLDHHDYPHVHDLKKLSSLMTYSPMFVSCFILNFPNLSIWLTAWLVHCMPTGKKRMIVSTTDAQCVRLPVRTLTAGLTELTS